MQKLIFRHFIGLISIAITAATSVVSVQAQTAGEYIDSTSPQVIEKISSNIVTFKDIQGQSRNYYVPNWMFEKYNLKVGSAMNLYNRNVIQGIYQNNYIDVVTQGLPPNKESFALDDTRRGCTLADSPASEGIASGKRVWYKMECCPSTIPVIGAMWSYVKREIAVVESRPVVITPPPAPVQRSAPVEVEKTPVQGLW